MLFSEMVTCGALIHGDARQFLRHGDDDPCALQVGGNDPEQLQLCTQMAEDAGYQEVNLNVGCPSDRVQQGEIGACLMARPELVAACFSQMQSKVRIPVSVKCRTGIDNQDSYEAFRRFVETVADAGCRVFYVHARKAFLQGLSPRENRQIPPLRYDFVYRIREDLPDCDFYLNGGLRSAEDSLQQLDLVKGIMLGRAAYQSPYLLAELERAVYGFTSPGRLEVVDAYLSYAADTQSEHIRPRHLLRHLPGLFKGQSGARQFRRHLSEQLNSNPTSLQIVADALEVSGLSEPEQRLAS